jgi:hypothetical protein
MHGGRVRVESELGKWTSFRFELPLPGTEDLGVGSEDSVLIEAGERLTG